MGFPSTLLLISLVSVGFSSCSAQGGAFTNVSLAGVVTCTNTSLSTARTYSVIPQAKVDVVCGLFQTVSKSTTTNFAGVYSFSFNGFDMLLNNPELCYLKVTLPSGSCTFDPPGGYLRFPIIAIRAFLGAVIDYIPGSPTYVTA